MTDLAELLDRFRGVLSTERLLDTAMRLIEVPSPTRSAGAAADRLAEILTADGFRVERPAAGWDEAPAVVARMTALSGTPGRTLQFNGHLDTVHLPFVPPRVDGGFLYGSGASDMKGGIAAMVEAARMLRDLGLPDGGAILITAHDLHEAPWGNGSQLDRLIDEGHVGDGVMLPEYLSQALPVVGRGGAVLDIAITRGGIPMHEVLGGSEQPNVIAAGAELIRRFGALDADLARRTSSPAGRESLFIGRAAGGEIYNQSPTRFEISGTRRWLPGGDRSKIEQEYREILADVANETGTTITGEFQCLRDAFTLETSDPLVMAFQQAHAAITGRELPTGIKPFVDDGNTFSTRAKIPAITHGPNATGAHTTQEQAPVAELARTALVYALTAALYCPTT